MGEGASPDMQEAVRAVIGYALWQTFYADSDWTRPFLADIACATLVGPAGIVRSDEVALGLFLLGPHTTYHEHAHGLDEVYHVASGRAEWRFDHELNRQAFGLGEIVHTERDQRHDIRTGTAPILCPYTWTNDPAAVTYHRIDRPWGVGKVVEPPLVG
ncbi:dimethylsulfonioproprionate lyase family protein [Falsirhodobacter halotolerans]|nr:dimethylsulfonioproprionate lyase family protein [Falsirhodobacter halotolerans]